MGSAERDLEEQLLSTFRDLKCDVRDDGTPLKVCGHSAANQGNRLLRARLVGAPIVGARVEK
jgi:hypothetical protein